MSNTYQVTVTKTSVFNVIATSDDEAIGFVMENEGAEWADNEKYTQYDTSVELIKEEEPDWA